MAVYIGHLANPASVDQTRSTWPARPNTIDVLVHKNTLVLKQDELETKPKSRRTRISVGSGLCRAFFKELRALRMEKSYIARRHF